MVDLGVLGSLEGRLPREGGHFVGVREGNVLTTAESVVTVCLVFAFALLDRVWFFIKMVP